MGVSVSGRRRSARRVGLSVTGKRMSRSMESACQRLRQVELLLDTSEAASFFAKATQDKSRLTRRGCAVTRARERRVLY